MGIGYKYLLLIGILNVGCSTYKKYMDEIPFELANNEKAIRDSLGLHSYDLTKLPREYEADLTDRQIYLKEKFAIICKVEPREILNYKFYDFIDQWLGTPYADKGFTERNLNISFFASKLFNFSHKVSLPNSAIEIFKSKELEIFTSRIYLQEGDIIFFRYNKSSAVSDIGIYLRNNKVLVSTPKNGLMITDFNQEYFQLRYIASGRIKNPIFSEK